MAEGNEHQYPLWEMFVLNSLHIGEDYNLTSVRKKNAREVEGILYIQTQR